MQSDYDNSLLRQAVINIKARDFGLARRYLERALVMADDRETRTWANYWMSQIVEDALEKRKYLEEALGNDPTHPEARKALAILDGKINPGDIVDPNSLSLAPAVTRKTQADRFACAKCGGRMVFDGDGRTLVCEYCARNQVVPTSAPQFEQDFILAMATGKGHRTPVAVKTFNCQGCGAQFILPAIEISAMCAYCGSPHVLVATRELVEPDSIVPMAFNQSQATLNLVEWVEKHKIKPEDKVLPPRGIYLPVWTFDIFGTVSWRGTVYRNKKQVPVTGDKNISFDDIVIPGASHLAEMLPKIMPGFDTSDAPAYDPRYLAGWPAEVYEKSMSDASLDARQKAVKRVRASINSEVGHINDLSYTTSNLSILSFKLVFIPLWYASYRQAGREYRVVINGQNGKAYGETNKKGVLGWLEIVLGE